MNQYQKYLVKNLTNLISYVDDEEEQFILKAIEWLKKAKVSPKNKQCKLLCKSS